MFKRQARYGGHDGAVSRRPWPMLVAATVFAAWSSGCSQLSYDYVGQDNTTIFVRQQAWSSFDPRPNDEDLQALDIQTGKWAVVPLAEEEARLKKLTFQIRENENCPPRNRALKAVDEAAKARRPTTRPLLVPDWQNPRERELASRWDPAGGNAWVLLPDGSVWLSHVTEPGTAEAQLQGELGRPLTYLAEKGFDQRGVVISKSHVWFLLGDFTSFAVVGLFDRQTKTFNLIEEPSQPLGHRVERIFEEGVQIDGAIFYPVEKVGQDTTPCCWLARRDPDAPDQEKLVAQVTDCLVRAYWTGSCGLGVAGRRIVVTGDKRLGLVDIDSGKLVTYDYVDSRAVPRFFNDLVAGPAKGVVAGAKMGAGAVLVGTGIINSH